MRVVSSALLLITVACSDGNEADAPAGGESPLSCENVETARRILRSVCDYYMERPVGSDAIFVGGYACRTLVAGYSIFVEPRYLAAAVEWGDRLLARQDSTGYWATGYSKHYYLADAASALGLLFVLYPHVGEDRRARYVDAVARHVTAIERDGLVLPSGALGAGWRFDAALRQRVPYRDEYTIASALTGVEVYTWMYVRTGETHYLDVARRALEWILGTMREDGVIPYVLAGEGGSLGSVGDATGAAGDVGGGVGGDAPRRRTRTGAAVAAGEDSVAARAERVLWETWRYDTAAYVGEGIVAFLAHCDRPELRRSIGTRIRPLIDMLVRTQNPDGTWALPGSADQKRSPGVVNLLASYYAFVEPDDAVRDAVCRFVGGIQDPHAGRAFGLQNAGASPNHANAIVTALTGRALAAIVAPDVDVRW